MSKKQPEKIKVIFEGKTWEFDYYDDLGEEHFKKVLSQQVPEIINATASTRFEENGSVKVIEFTKQLKYKG